MNSEGSALNQIIILAQSEMRLAIARLQVAALKARMKAHRSKGR